MAQESTALNTQNQASGGALASLGDFFGSLIQPATAIYTLKLQNDQLKQQSNSAIAAAQLQQAAAQNAQAQSQTNATKWLIWGGIVLAGVVVIGLVFRRRSRA
jgi:hypothetical protein